MNLISLVDLYSLGSLLITLAWLGLIFSAVVFLTHCSCRFSGLSAGPGSVFSRARALCAGLLFVRGLCALDFSPLFPNVLQICDGRDFYHQC